MSNWLKTSPRIVSFFAILVAGILGSSDSASAGLYDWVPTTPGDGTSGLLTIPDAEASIGDHALIPGDGDGSWTDPSGDNWRSGALGLSYRIFADGVLQEIFNSWSDGQFNLTHVESSGEITVSAGNNAAGAYTLYEGRWVPQVTGVPDGGSSGLLLALVLLPLRFRKQMVKG